MKFSVRVNYGLRAAGLLAERFGDGRPVLGREIAETEALPVAYLEQIMGVLRRADLVSGTRGKHGGYVLTRPPQEVSVLELIDALEGPPGISECSSRAACCDDPDACAVCEVLEAGEDALRSAFASVRLPDLAERRRILREHDNMYHI